MNRISNCQPLAVRREHYGPEGFERRACVVSHIPESVGTGGTDTNEAGDR